MADPLYTIRRALCVVLEDTEGTDQEPAVGDVVLCRTLCLLYTSPSPRDS